MSEWKPISTAPINKNVLVCFVDRFAMPPNVMYCGANGIWHEAASDGRYLKEGYAPSHWTDLPPLPEGQ